MRLAALMAMALGTTSAEEIFSVPVWHDDSRFLNRLEQRLHVVAIDDGENDQLLVTISSGGLYEWSAKLRIGPSIITVPTADLLYSGVRIRLGDAFTKAQWSTMRLHIERGYLK